MVIEDREFFSLYETLAAQGMRVLRSQIMDLYIYIYNICEYLCKIHLNTYKLLISFLVCKLKLNNQEGKEESINQGKFFFFEIVFVFHHHCQCKMLVRHI